MTERRYPEPPMKKPLLRAAFLATVITASLLLPVPARAESCATFHARGFLTGFPSFVGSLFYAGREGGSATAAVRVSPGCSDSPPGLASVSVLHVTEAITATSGTDFVENDFQTPPLCDDVHGQCAAQGHSPSAQADVNLVMGGPGGPGEPVVESFRFRLTGTEPPVTPPGYRDPFSVPVYVVDVDVPGRASFEPGVGGYARSESFTHILVPVFLSGTGSGPVAYTTAADPAAPATPGQDYNDLSGGAVSVNAQGYGFINIGIVNDKIGEGPESLVITLGGTVDGANTMKVTIEDNEESVKPTSRFHHPRNGWRYKKSDYRIREVHIFADDNLGKQNVVRVQFALRRNLKNGGCVWLTAGGWQKKDCQNREWRETQYDNTGELWRFRLKQLKSSVGTRIKNYTAFSRAFDGADNVENDFVVKRNANTFEIRGTRRRR